MKKVEYIVWILGIGANGLYLHQYGLIRLPYILAALILWMIAAGLHQVFHELGHLLGGLVSGYRLVCLSLATIRVTYHENRKLKLSFGKDRGGQCVMEPRNRNRCHYLCYNLGGVAANLVLVLAAWGLFPAGSHVTALLMIDMIWVGIQKILVNGIPAMVGGFPTDARVVKLLHGNEWVKKDYNMYLSLYAALFRGEAVEKETYVYSRPLDVPEAELLYYREIQAILKEMKDTAVL